MTKLGVLSTHAKLLRSKSPLQFWCVVKSLKLDKPRRVSPNANSLRCGRPLSLRQRQERRSHLDDTSPSKPPGDRVQLHPVRHAEGIPTGWRRRQRTT